MPNLLKQLDVSAQTINYISPVEVVLKYAFNQLQLSDSVSNHCNLNIARGDATGSYRFENKYA